MAKDHITPEEGAELQQLELDYLDALVRAQEAIKAGGMLSEGFLKADAEMGAIVKRRREILGLSGQHWMA